MVSVLLHLTDVLIIVEIITALNISVLSHLTNRLLLMEAR